MIPQWVFNSNTIRGALLAILPTISLILKTLGIEILDGELEKVIDGLAGLAGMVSIIMVIVARVKREKAVGSGEVRCSECRKKE